jgi:ABC-2 type transport system permease protein
MLVVAAIFLAVPTSLSAMVALLAVRILPVRRAREVMSAALALVFLAVWTGMQLLRSSLDAHGASGVGEMVALARTNLLLMTPAGWAAAVLSGLSRGDWTSVAVFSSLLAGSTAVMIAVSATLVDAIYARGVGKDDSASLDTGKGRARQSHASSSTGSLLRAAFLRDARLMRREPTQLVQLLMLAAMMVVMTIVLKRDTEGEPLSHLEMLMPFLFVVMFSAMSTVGIAARLIPLEGKAFYLTKIAPQRPMRSLAAKLLLGWMLGTAVALFGATVVTIVFSHPLAVGLGGFAVASLVCLGSSGLGLVVGAYFADFDWESPKRMITVGGGFISAVVPLVFTALLGGVCFVLYLFLHSLLGVETVLAVAGSVLMGLAVSVTVSALSLLAAGRRVESMAWPY